MRRGCGAGGPARRHRHTVWAQTSSRGISGALATISPSCATAGPTERKNLAGCIAVEGTTGGDGRAHRGTLLVRLQLPPSMVTPATSGFAANMGYLSQSGTSSRRRWRSLQTPFTRHESDVVELCVLFLGLLRESFSAQDQ